MDVIFSLFSHIQFIQNKVQFVTVNNCAKCCYFRLNYKDITEPGRGWGGVEVLQHQGKIILDGQPVLCVLWICRSSNTSNERADK